MTARDDARMQAAFTGLADLASATLGGEALACSDDFFAGMENLLRPERAVFDPDRYTERGKWMDGWESRRRRVPGYDWCIVRLGVPGTIRGVDIDTDHFLGNHPAYGSVEAIAAPGADADALQAARWTEIVPPTPLERGARNLLPARVLDRWTHVRLNIHPDGGVARLRCYGDPEPDPPAPGAEVDLAAVACGGQAVAASDMFFGDVRQLTAPGRPANMGQGWESRRSRGPHQDWALIRLATSGRLARVELDTEHFKGNFPDHARVLGICWPDAPISGLVDSAAWREVVPDTRLRPHDRRAFEVLADRGPFTHLKIEVYPDGGVARLRAFGRPEEAPRGALAEALDGDEAADLLRRCCGAPRWVEGMLARRPFSCDHDVLHAADAVWWALDERDWRAAYDHHPRIGADVDALRAKFGATAALSEGEQAGVQGATEATLAALAQGNTDYEARFGHIFIVCASGLGADEMLARLHHRLDNDPDAERMVAANEQARITRLRLQGLTSGATS